MFTGIIFTSKNGRWIITRGQNKWRIMDTFKGMKLTVFRVGDSFSCKEPVPMYLMKHIEHDAEVLEVATAPVEAN